MLSLECTILDHDGLAALASALWLTQLVEPNLSEGGNVSHERHNNIIEMVDMIEDDAGAFGRLRRLGCVISFTLQ